MPERRSNSRRVSEQPRETSIDIHHLAGEQQQLGVLLPGRKLCPVGSGRGRRNELPANRQLMGIRRAVQDLAIQRGDFGIVALYRQVLNRAPDAHELTIGRQFISAASATADGTKLSAWEQYAQLLLLTSEVMYVD